MRPLVLIAVLATTLLGAAPAGAETTLYVGDTEEYAITLIAEEGQLYVVELAGTTHCYYTEPYEPLGTNGFSAFAAPTLLRDEGEGLRAFGGGPGHSLVRAELDGETVRGEFDYSESELSYHCDTGFTPKPFLASRYLPIGSGSAPVSGERPVYYGSDPSTEVFLRVINGKAGGIRGTFVPRCRVARSKKVPAKRALFDGPSDFTELNADGSFETKDVEEGLTRTGAHYKEKITFTGAVTEDAVVGAYIRIRRTKPRGKPVHRCVTGPLPYRAVRYLPPAA